MEVIKNNPISNLSDSEFLSVLYSERDRENSLTQVPGWSYWAIIGAGITILCTAYYILKEHLPLNGISVLYLTSAFLALVLSFGSFFRILSIGRTVDYSRVRLMKEVIPVVHVCFVFLCSIALAILILLSDGCNVVFWLWTVLLLVFSLALATDYCFKNTIVPAFYYDTMLPWTKANIAFEIAVTVLYVQIAGNSFRKASGVSLSSEFEIAACIAGFVALMYLFFKMRDKNDTVLRIDDIIEGYLYKDVSKEDSFHQLSINRWGYGVLDACQKELKDVENRYLICDKDKKDLEVITDSLQTHDASLDDIDRALTQISLVLNRQKGTDLAAEKLNDRVAKIFRVAPALRDVTELDYLLNSIETITSKVDGLQAEVTGILKMVKERQKEIRSRITLITESSKDKEDIINENSKRELSE